MEHFSTESNNFAKWRRLYNQISVRLLICDQLIPMMGLKWTYRRLRITKMADYLFLEIDRN